MSPPPADPHPASDPGPPAPDADPPENLGGIVFPGPFAPGIPSPGPSAVDVSACPRSPQDADTASAEFPANVGRGPVSEGPGTTAGGGGTSAISGGLLAGSGEPVSLAPFIATETRGDPWIRGDPPMPAPAPSVEAISISMKTGESKPRKPPETSEINIPPPMCANSERKM